MQREAFIGARRIHLVNPLWDWNGGSERRTVETWNLIKRAARVQVWSEYEPSPKLAAMLPVRLIRPWRFSLPFSGTIVFVGVYFRIGHWIRLARPQRVVVLYNTHQPDRLEKNLRRIEGAGHKAEVVASSAALAGRLGRNLPLLESPIDLSAFASLRRARGRPFTVGRLSRDDSTKHHHEDPELYRLLAAAGCRVRIMGGTCLARLLEGTANVELLPAGAEDAAPFLASLDCFVYRTAERWFEGFGRVVFEAMGSGLPVVASRRGGYADYVVDNRDCMLFDSTEEAASHVLAIRDDSMLRERLASCGRTRAHWVVGERLARRTREFLTSPQALTQATLLSSLRSLDTVPIPDRVCAVNRES